MGVWSQGFEDWLTKNSAIVRLAKGLPVFEAPSDDIQKCLNEGNKAAQPIYEDVLDLAKNWHPSGFYTTSQIQEIVKQTLTVLSATNDRLRSINFEEVNSMRDDAIKQVQKRFKESLVYRDFVASAISRGTKVIDAPQLRDWVLDSLLESVNATVTAFTLKCETPWFVGVINKLIPVFHDAAKIIGSIIGFAADLIETVKETIEKLPGAAVDLITYAKYGALLGVGYFIYKKLSKKP
jgi:hypothetical protein